MARTSTREASMFHLDGKQLSADMGTVRRRIFELAAKRWRLLSERDKRTRVVGPWVPPADDRDAATKDADLTAIVAGQGSCLKPSGQFSNSRSSSLGNASASLSDRWKG